MPNPIATPPPIRVHVANTPGIDARRLNENQNRCAMQVVAVVTSVALGAFYFFSNVYAEKNKVENTPLMFRPCSVVEHQDGIFSVTCNFDDSAIKEFYYQAFCIGTIKSMLISTITSFFLQIFLVPRAGNEN